MKTCFIFLRTSPSLFLVPCFHKLEHWDSGLCTQGGIWGAGARVAMVGEGHSSKDACASLPLVLKIGR